MNRITVSKAKLVQDLNGRIIGDTGEHKKFWYGNFIDISGGDEISKQYMHIPYTIVTYDEDIKNVHQYGFILKIKYAHLKSGVVEYREKGKSLNISCLNSAYDIAGKYGNKIAEAIAGYCEKKLRNEFAGKPNSPEKEMYRNIYRGYHHEQDMEMCIFANVVLNAPYEENTNNHKIVVDRRVYDEKTGMDLYTLLHRSSYDCGPSFTYNSLFTDGIVVDEQVNGNGQGKGKGKRLDLSSMENLPMDTGTERLSVTFDDIVGHDVILFEPYYISFEVEYERDD